MQRLHERDPSGYILAKELDWVHLCLPAWFEPDHPFMWPGDPRTQPGELLFPQRFGPKEPGDVIVCRGMPYCMLEDEHAVEAQNAGCHICRRFVLNLDGTETEYRVKPH